MANQQVLKLLKQSHQARQRAESEIRRAALYEMAARMLKSGKATTPEGALALAGDYLAGDLPGDFLPVTSLRAEKRVFS